VNGYDTGSTSVISLLGKLRTTHIPANGAHLLRQTSGAVREIRQTASFLNLANVRRCTSQIAGGMWDDVPLASPIPNLAGDGPFKPTWDSLLEYEAPDWYRDAKFGIWGGQR